MGYIASYRNYDNYRGLSVSTDVNQSRWEKTADLLLFPIMENMFIMKRYGNDADTLYVKAGKTTLSWGSMTVILHF